MARARYTLVTMMKDEGPYLLEWLAYHRLIGFDRIWVYSNDCRDGTDAMLDRLQAMGLLRHLRNVVPEGRKPQPHALTQAGKRKGLADTEWLVVMDADEFVHVTCGDGHLDDLVAALPEGTQAVSLTWRIMGSNGHTVWNPGPVIESYTRGAPDDWRRGWGVKTLFRPFEDMKLGIHRPTVKGAKRDDAQMAALQGLYWVNGSGQPMPPSFIKDGWRNSTASLGRELGEVAHFATRSVESFFLRRDRGNVNLKPDKYDSTYFAVFDRNETPQEGLTRHLGPVMKQVAAWLKDDVLGPLATAATAWHDARVDTLLRDPDGKAFLARLYEAAGTSIADLDKLVYTQALTEHGRSVVADRRAKGIPEEMIAQGVAKELARLERDRDAREAAELAALRTPGG